MKQAQKKRVSFLLGLCALQVITLCACNEPEAAQTEQSESLGSSLFKAKKGAPNGKNAGKKNAALFAAANLKHALSTDFDPQGYSRAVQEKIKENWHLPPTLATRSGVVTFAIDHGGEVSDVKIKESSGLPEFDRSCITAVEKSVPMPRLAVTAPPKIFIEFTFDERLFRGIATRDDLKKLIAEETKVIDQNPSDIQAHTKRARAFLKLGQYDRAISDYSALLALNEDDVEAFMQRAKCYLYIDEYQKALEDCQQCQKLAPSLAKPYFYAATAWLGLGQLRQALTAIDTSLNLQPVAAESWAFRANCDNLALQHKEAIKDCARALSIDPDYGAAYAYRGDAYEAMKDYDAALRDYTKNIELDPAESQAYLRRTELYSTLGQYGKAVFDATEAIRLAPTNAEAYYYRSHANEELGLKAQAQKDLEKARQYGMDKSAPGR